MKYLLDTHTLLWFLQGDKKLSDKARQLIDSPHNEKFLSITSLWEIAIKVSLAEPFNSSIKRIFSFFQLSILPPFLSGFSSKLVSNIH